jgi:hypothetical protein
MGYLRKHTDLVTLIKISFKEKDMTPQTDLTGAAEEYPRNQMQDAANAFDQAYASCMAGKGLPGQ